MLRWMVVADQKQNKKTFLLKKTLDFLVRISYNIT